MRLGLKIALFFTLFLGMSLSMNWFYLRKVMKGHALELQYQELKSSKGPIKCLALGDSHVMTAINPEYIPGSFNFASLNESPILSYYKLLHLLDHDHKSIQQLLLPFDLHYFSSYRTDIFTSNFFHVQYADYVEIGNTKGKRILYISKYLQGKYFAYAEQYEEMLNYLFLNDTKTIPPMNRGYTGSWTGIYTEKPNHEWMAKDRASSHFEGYELYDVYLVEYFDKILKLCKDRRIKVTLVKYPVTDLYLEEAAKLLTEGIEQKELQTHLLPYPEVRVFDFQRAFSGQNQLFSDPDHLNVEGAVQFSQRLNLKLLAE